jgi:hypothetical protein
MTISRPQANGSARLRIWLRRGHRWLGIVLVFFVLLLSFSGVALNHAEAWGLDRRYLDWSWLLDAYGIQAPAPTASFADSGSRATLIGERLFLDDEEIAQNVTVLTGIANLDPLVLVGTDDTLYILTTAGELIEAMDAAAGMPGRIDRVGRDGRRAIVESGGKLFRSDPDITHFEHWDTGQRDGLQWSSTTRPEATELEVLQTLYRGRGLTVERVLADVHSGRIFAKAGSLIMDAVAVFMIVLSLSGFVLWVQHSRREVELERRNGRRR